MKRLLGVGLLGLGLLAPMAVTLQAGQDHKHEWADSEKDAWHRYLKERHIKDHEWEKASKRERDNYWKWRDKHPG
jgi:hypothetical protein